KMDDGVDFIFPERVGNQRPMANVASYQRHIGWHQESTAGGEIVKHDRSNIGGAKSSDRMASYVTGAACNEDRHDQLPVFCWFSTPTLSQSGITIGRSD